MDKEKSGKFMFKMMGDVATALATSLLVVGDRTGLFRAMAGAGWLSALDVAQRSGRVVAVC